MLQNNYMWSINTLEHSGVKGMKWGIRRYQNEDGTLTPAGRERYGVGDPKGESAGTESVAEKPKSYLDKYSKAEQTVRNANKLGRKKVQKAMKELDDDEMKRVTARMELESKYNKFLEDEKEKNKSKARKILEKALTDAGSKAVSDIADYAVGSMVNKIFGTDINQRAANLNNAKKKRIEQEKKARREAWAEADQRRADKKAQNKADKEAKKQQSEERKEQKTQQKAEKAEAKKVKDAEKQAAKQAKKDAYYNPGKHEKVSAFRKMRISAKKSAGNAFNIYNWTSSNTPDDWRRMGSEYAKGSRKYRRKRQ